MHAPVEILLLTHYRGEISGVERDWINAANGLTARRARITWVGIDGTDALTAESEAVVRAVDANLPVFSYLVHQDQYSTRSAWLWSKIVLDHLRRSARTARELSARLSSDGWRYQLVLSGSSVITTGALLARWRRTPHVWAVKEWLDPDRRESRAFARAIRALSDVVVVPSAAMAEAFGGAAEVVPDGSDPGRIGPVPGAGERARLLTELGLPVDKPLLVQCGTLCWWKGQHVLLDALALLAASSSAPDFSMLFLGGGAPPYATSLRAQADRLPAKWRSRVRFVTAPPGDLRLMGSADVLVHPSVLPDPFPNAVREGMLLGRAIVASRGGGIPEMLTDGQSGVLVEPSDAAALAAGLACVLRDDDLRGRLGREARRRGRAELTNEVTAEKLDRVLRAAARDQRRRAETT